MMNFDELLDGVLREDAAAEPRAGLEGRVMARVRADEVLPRGSFSRYWNRRRKWLFVPAGACLGIAALIWYGVDGGVPQPRRIVSRVSSSGFSAPSVGETEGDGRSSLGGSGHALRDSHLSDDKTVAKMGHPVLVAREVKPLPKLDVFPTPSVAAEPVQKLAEVSRRYPKTVLLGLGRSFAESKPPEELKIEPIEIARIEIAPLYPVKDTGATEEQGR